MTTRYIMLTKGNIGPTLSHSMPSLTHTNIPPIIRWLVLVVQTRKIQFGYIYFLFFWRSWHANLPLLVKSASGISRAHKIFEKKIFFYIQLSFAVAVVQRCFQAKCKLVFLTWSKMKRREAKRCYSFLHIDVQLFFLFGRCIVSQLYSFPACQLPGVPQ